MKSYISFSFWKVRITGPLQWANCWAKHCTCLWASFKSHKQVYEVVTIIPTIFKVGHEAQMSSKLPQDNIVRWQSLNFLAIWYQGQKASLPHHPKYLFTDLVLPTFSSTMPSLHAISASKHWVFLLQLILYDISVKMHPWVITHKLLSSGY